MILAPVVGAAVPAQAESSQQAFINEIGNSAAAVAIAMICMLPS